MKVTEEEIDAMALEIDEDGSGAGQFVFLSSEPRCFTKTGSGQAQKKLQKDTRFCRNHGITYQQNSTEGDLFIKLPNISFPFTDTGDLILAMGNQVHTDAGVSVTLEAALKTGAINAFWPPVFFILTNQLRVEFKRTVFS